jgi:hypothetical protein
MFLSIPIAVHVQPVDAKVVDQVMHDYFEAYSSGNMVAVMKFINVPFVVNGPKGFTAFTTADEALEWYTKLLESDEFSSVRCP